MKENFAKTMQKTVIKGLKKEKEKLGSDRNNKILRNKPTFKKQ